MRFNKLENAQRVILKKIHTVIRMEPSKKNSRKEIFLMLQNERLLIINKDNRFIVKKMNTRELEDMLQLLQQFDLITKYEYVCGKVFRVFVNILPLGNDNIVFMSLKKAA